jgi:transcriptional regulator with XRE-family HTH domain
MKTIRELRTERGWSQLKLANLLGVTPSTIYHWERGDWGLSAVALRDLARVFEVRMEDIELPVGKGKVAA